MQEPLWIQTFQNITKLNDLMENKLNGYNMSEIATCMEEILEFQLNTWKFVHACMDWSTFLLRKLDSHIF